MTINRSTDKELKARLAELDAIIAALRAEQVDAVVSKDRVVVLRPDGELEEALRESREQFRIIYDKSPLAIALCDAEGRLLNANKACLEFFGAPDIRDILKADILSHCNNAKEIIDDIRAGKSASYQSVFDFDEAAGRGFTNCSREGSVYIEVFVNSTSRSPEKPATGCLIQIRDITERMRLENALKEREKQLENLYRQLIIAQEEERKRIAQNLHDEFGQRLTMLGMEVEYMRKNEKFELSCLDNMSSALEKLGDELQMLYKELRPIMLDKMGLEPALISLVDEYRKIGTFAIECRLNPVACKHCEPLGIFIYRILQEALTNVARHSGADKVEVVLESQGLDSVFVIRDNGKGFDPKAGLASERRGLTGMVERAAACGASLEIESSPGVGTALKVTIPASAQEMKSS